MPFYVYAWIATIFGGLFVITAKLTSKHTISNPWLFNFLLSSVTLLFMLPPAIYYHAVIPNNWIMIIMAAIFLTLTNIFYIFSNKSLDVSVFMPLYNFKSIFAVLIGIIFFRENIAVNKLFFVAVIFIAGILISLDEKFSLKSFFKVTIAVGIATVFFNTLFNAFTKTVMLTNSLWTATLWVVILNFIFVIPTIPLFKNEIKKLNFSHIIPVGLMGLFVTVGIFASNKAYQGNLGISSMIMNVPFSMIIAFVFSIFAPKLLEKHTLKIYAIRFAFTAIMIWAAMQLTK
ncbi:MAG: hypothetical protein AAB437_00965 [Patescibacteria group bacterium]